eukprot:g3116.t1
MEGGDRPAKTKAIAVRYGKLEVTTSSPKSSPKDINLGESWDDGDDDDNEVDRRSCSCCCCCCCCYRSCDHRWRDVFGEVITSRKTWVLWSLAFVNGWADVLTMLRYFAFATVMTGNSIYLVEAIARGCWHDVMVYTLLIFAFALGVVTYRAISRAMATRWFRRRVKNWRIGPATVIAPIVLLMYLTADLAYYGGDNAGDKHFHCGKTPRAGVWGILPVTYAMGAVNSVSVTVDKTTTNSITGHILKVSAITYDTIRATWFGGAEVPVADKSKLVVSLGVILMLLTGIGTGTIVTGALHHEPGVAGGALDEGHHHREPNAERSGHDSAAAVDNDAADVAGADRRRLLLLLRGGGGGGAGGSGGAGGGGGRSLGSGGGHVHHVQAFEPTFFILGAAFALLLCVHDYLLMDREWLLRHRHSAIEKQPGGTFALAVERALDRGDDSPLPKDPHRSPPPVPGTDDHEDEEQGAGRGLGYHCSDDKEEGGSGRGADEDGASERKSDSRRMLEHRLTLSNVQMD